MTPIPPGTKIRVITDGRVEFDEAEIVSSRDDHGTTVYYIMSEGKIHWPIYHQEIHILKP